MGTKGPLPTFITFIERMRDAHPKIAYIHAVEPRLDGITGVDLT